MQIKVNFGDFIKENPEAIFSMMCTIGVQTLSCIFFLKDAPKKNKSEGIPMVIRFIIFRVKSKPTIIIPAKRTMLNFIIPLNTVSRVLLFKL